MYGSLNHSLKEIPVVLQSFKGAPYPRKSIERGRNTLARGQTRANM